MSKKVGKNLNKDFGSKYSQLVNGLVIKLLMKCKTPKNLSTERDT